MSMSSRNHWILVALLAFLYFATGKISYILFVQNGVSSIGLFPAEGIALAFALYYGRQVTPGIFIGQTLLALSNDFGLLPALEVGLINTLEALIAIEAVKRLRIDTRFHTFRDALLFTAMVLLILQPFSAFVSNAMFTLHHKLPADQFWPSVYDWWFGNILGQLLVAPFILTLLQHRRQIDWRRYVGYGTHFGLYVGVLIFFFHLHSPMLLLSLTLPVLIWATARHGLACGSMLTVVIAVVTALSIFAHTGPFFMPSKYESGFEYNLFVLLYIALTLTFGVIFGQIRRHQKELETRIEEALRQNREQQALLMRQSRLAQMGEMIAMIAHQWRQPLNNLSLANQLLISRYKKGTLNDDHIEAFERNSKKQIKLMSQTIDDFRNFFRPKESKIVFDLGDQLKKSLEIFEQSFISHGITLTTRNLDTPCRVYGFPNAFSQAVMNILNNAKDALLDRDQVDKRVWVELEKGEREIIVRISDNAGGIREDLLDKIFEPYFSTKSEKNGTGLGLYMTKTIVVDQMNGSIEVKNEGDGALFTIILPLDHDTSNE